MSNDGISYGGVVTALDGRTVTVRVPAGASACRRCAEGRGCGAGLMRFVAERDRLVRARVGAAERPAVGSAVSIECVGPGVARAALIGYGGPLAGFMSAVLLVSAAAPSRPLLAAGCGVAGMLTAVIGCRWLARHDRPDWVIRAPDGAA